MPRRSRLRAAANSQPCYHVLVRQHPEHLFWYHSYAVQKGTTMPETISWSELQTPLGTFGFASSERGLLTLLLPNAVGGRDLAVRRLSPGAEIVCDNGHNAEAVRQVSDYLAGERKVFDLPLDQRGSEFQISVWRAVYEVPWGETASYGEIARRVGWPDAARAVGAANGANPHPIIVPCHRIIGSDGSLTGFGGGLPLKRALLALEGFPVQQELGLSF
jgi:O-6-methylguanine DNA methyltransferase